ncbi:MAG TPA: hypothetical protein VIW74_04995 [Pyrinomonadaceae bacterium]|jgi:hypothetical protein
MANATGVAHLAMRSDLIVQILAGSAFGKLLLLGARRQTFEVT